MELLKEMIALIDKGGIISWIITFLYLVVLSITLERIIFFIRSHVSYNKVENLLLRVIERKQLRLFLRHPHGRKKKKSQALRMVRHYIKNSHLGKEAFEESLDREGFFIVAEMESNIWVLSQIGHIAPLMGLLGTVIGLISAFQVIASLGAEADVASFSSGIWEAMITTANGLIVAIPSFFLYRILEKIVEKRSNQMTRLVSLLNEYQANSSHQSYYENSTTSEKDEPHEMF